MLIVLVLLVLLSLKYLFNVPIHKKTEAFFFNYIYYIDTGYTLFQQILHLIFHILYTINKKANTLHHYALFKERRNVCMVSIISDQKAKSKDSRLWLQIILPLVFLYYS